MESRCETHHAREAHTHKPFYRFYRYKIPFQLLLAKSRSRKRMLLTEEIKSQLAQLFMMQYKWNVEDWRYSKGYLQLLYWDINNIETFNSLSEYNTNYAQLKRTQLGQFHLFIYKKVKIRTKSDREYDIIKDMAKVRVGESHGNNPFKEVKVPQQSASSIKDIDLSGRSR